MVAPGLAAGGLPTSGRGRAPACDGGMDVRPEAEAVCALPRAAWLESGSLRTREFKAGIAMAMANAA